MIERYVAMADKALAQNDIQPAQAAQQKARAVAGEFGIANDGFQGLGARLAAKERELAEERKREEAQRGAEAKAAEERTGKAARVDDIDSFLEKAKKALAANRLTTPAGIMRLLTQRRS